MPLVDPKVFQEFWAERQRARKGQPFSSSDNHILRVETVKAKERAMRRPWSAVEKGKRAGTVAGGSAANLRALRAQKRSAWSRNTEKKRSTRRNKVLRPVSAQPRLPTGAAHRGPARGTEARQSKSRTRPQTSYSQTPTSASKGLGRAAKRAASTSALTKPRPGSKLSSSESEKLFKL